MAHLPGVGPETLKAFHRAHIRTWADIIEHPNRVPVRPRLYEAILNEIFRCEQAIAGEDIMYLVRTLEPRDHGRILGHWFERAAFFDIETEGVEAGSPVTVISCLHRGTLDVYVRGENLDAFLESLDEVDLLVSFNGSSFDVPRIARHFNIPSIPCPHVDLRWLCYHGGHEGGLKNIELALGIQRPDDLRGVDGKDAELFWKLWTIRKDATARQKLIRYCAGDSLALKLVASALLQSTADAGALWKLLDGLAVPAPTISVPAVATPAPEFEKLQARWNRMKAMRAARIA